MVTTVMKPAACFVRAGTVTEKRAPAPTVVWRDTLEVGVIKVSFSLFTNCPFHSFLGTIESRFFFKFYILKVYNFFLYVNDHYYRL